MALLLVMLVSPFLDDTMQHRFYMVVLFAIVLLAAILAASRQRRQRLIALGIGVPWIVLSLIALAWESPAVIIYANVMASLFCVYVLCHVLLSIVRTERVDLDTLMGAASVYLLIALAWTTSYQIIHLLDPDAFALVHGESRPYFHQFLYFSLTTLTTVGYGDITPVNPFAQIWSTLQAVVGTLYMALLVARLVGLYQSREPRQP